MPSKQDDSSKNINTGGGAYVGGNVEVNGGDFVGGNKTTHIHHAPSQPTAAELFEKGRKQLRARQYAQAIEFFEDVIELDPEFHGANYYLAMALLRGNRPNLVRLETIRSIENHLRRAIELQPQDSGAYILWAFVKYDYYVLNGMYDRPPSHEQLLNSISSINPLQVQEILALTTAEDNPVLQWLRRVM